MVYFLGLPLLCCWTNDEERVEEVLFVVDHWFAVFSFHHFAAGTEGNGVSGSRVPFHGGGEARIDVGAAFSHEADF